MDIVSNIKSTDYQKIMSTNRSDNPCILVKYNSIHGHMKFNKFYYLLSYQQYENLKNFLLIIPHDVDELFEWLKSQVNLYMNDEGIWELCSDYNFDEENNKKRIFFNIWKQPDGKLGFWINE